jgi:hypothetical protein
MLLFCVRAGAIPPLPQSTFMAWYLVNHRETLLIPLSNRPNFQCIWPSGTEISWFHQNKLSSFEPKFMLVSLLSIDDAHVRRNFISSDSYAVPDVLTYLILNLIIGYSCWPAHQLLVRPALNICKLSLSHTVTAAPICRSLLTFRPSARNNQTKNVTLNCHSIHYSKTKENRSDAISEKLKLISSLFSAVNNIFRQTKHNVQLSF